MAPQTGKAALPELVVLDVNETLSDLSPLRGAFDEVGLDPREVEAWFAGVLRDGFALTVVGDNPSFATIAGSALEARLVAAGRPDPAADAQHVMSRFVELQPHPDVVPGLRALADAGCRIVTLSNGSANIARGLLESTGAGDLVEAYLEVADAAAWKPAASAYAHALETCSVEPGRAMLVAAHSWDIEGARRAGLRTAWVNRDGALYPRHFGKADVEVSGFVDLRDQLQRS